VKKLSELEQKKQSVKPGEGPSVRDIHAEREPLRKKFLDKVKDAYDKPGPEETKPQAH